MKIVRRIAPAGLVLSAIVSIVGLGVFWSGARWPGIFPKANAATVDVATGCVYQPDGSLFTGSFYLFVFDSEYQAFATGFSAIVNSTSTGCYRISYDASKKPKTGNYYLQFYTPDISAPTYTQQFFPIKFQTLPSTQTLDLHLATPTRFISGRVTDTEGNGQSAVTIYASWLYGVERYVEIGRLTPGASGDFTLPISSSINNVTLRLWPSDQSRYFSIDPTGAGSFAPKTPVTFVSGETGTKQVVFTLFPTSSTALVNGTVDPIASNLGEDIHLKLTEQTTGLTMITLLPTSGTFSIPLTPGVFSMSVDGKATREDGSALPLVTVRAGQPANIGVISPVLWDEDDSAESYHPIITSGNKAEKLDSKMAWYLYYPLTTDERWASTFALSETIDPSSTGAVLRDGALILDPAQASGDLAMAKSSSIGPVDGVISKLWLVDYWSDSIERDRLRYEVSFDNTTWQIIVPGTALTPTAAQQTAKNLRWRATVVSGSDSVRIDAIRLYTQIAVPAYGRPVVESVTYKKTSSGYLATIFGHNLGNSPRVYLAQKQLSCTTKIARTLYQCAIGTLAELKSGNHLILLNERGQADFITTNGTKRER